MGTAGSCQRPTKIGLDQSEALTKSLHVVDLSPAYSTNIAMCYNKLQRGEK